MRWILSLLFHVWAWRLREQIAKLNRQKREIKQKVARLRQYRDAMMLQLGTQPGEEMEEEGETKPK